MIVKVHKPSSTPGSDNKGSSSSLISYLEKENNSLENEGYFFGQTKEKEGFQNDITKTQAVIGIDSNTKKLGKDDTKFFMITLNFSEKEQKHMAKKITNRNLNSINDMTAKEKAVYEKKMQDFTQKVMDDYAKNFNRGLEGKDMIYVAKIEHERRYKGTDDKVKNGQVTSGSKKEGFQSHVHIVVSRKDRSQSLKLSPNAKERIGRSGHVVGEKNVTKGFNHESFKLVTENSFDKEYQYKRKYEESYQSQSKNEALLAVKDIYKEHLTPQEYKEMSALSDQNIDIILKYFTRPNSAMIDKIKGSIKEQLNLKARVSTEMMKTL